MAKKNKPEPYKDVNELNWEETEKPAAEEMMLFDPGVLRFSIAQQLVGEALLMQLQKVEPEIRKDNPVMKWALCDDHTTFIFRNGQKVTVSF